MEGTAANSASAIIVAIGTLMVSGATAYGLWQRSRKVEKKVNTNTDKLDDIGKTAVARAEVEGWKLLIETATAKYQESENRLYKLTEEYAHEKGRFVATIDKLEHQFAACEEGRIALNGKLEKLRGEFEEYRRLHNGAAIPHGRRATDKPPKK